jgi:hypothetical protein
MPKTNFDLHSSTLASRTGASWPGHQRPRHLRSGAILGNLSTSREDGGSGVLSVAPPAPASSASSKLDGAAMGETHETSSMDGASISKSNLMEAVEDCQSPLASESHPGNGRRTPQLTETTETDPSRATGAIYGSHGPSSGSLREASRRADDNQPASRRADVPVGTNRPHSAAAAHKRLSVPVVPSLDARTLGTLPKRTLSDSKGPTHGKERCLELPFCEALLPAPLSGLTHCSCSEERRAAAARAGTRCVPQRRPPP